MGLLDWLDSAIGGGGAPPMQQTGMDQPPLPNMGTSDIGGGMTSGQMPPPYPQGTDPMTAGMRPPIPAPLPTQAIPPVQPLDAPPTQPFAQGGDPMQASPPPLPPGGDPVNGSGSGLGPNSISPPGLPPGMPVPMPQPRPAGANVSPQGVPGVMPTPPGAPTDISAAARAPGGVVQPPAPDSNAQAQTIIGRSLGLDRNKERGIFGSLAGGLNAAGNSAGKGKGQALFSGAGGALEGGNKSDKEIADEQDKFLGRKIAGNNSATATANGNSTRELNTARTQLALAQAKQAMTGGGKDSVMNSQQQLYLRGQGLVNSDPEVKLAKSTYDNALKNFDPGSKEVKDAAAAHAALVESKTKQHMQALGVNPKTVASIAKQPGMSQDNPVPKAGLDQKKFDSLPPGAYFINPKDGRVLQKSGTPQGGAGAAPQAAPQQGMTPAVPPVPPAPVTAPAGSRADNPDDED